jgi:protein-S-isoprenylcysteine O-methyltransferase Ste14
MPKILDYPPVWLVLALVSVWALGQMLPMDFLGVHGRRVGTGLVALGFVLMLAALAQMVAARTTFIPRRDPDALVMGGVFAISRNPIYLGDVLVLAGFALRWDVILGLPLVLVFMTLIQKRFILQEEALLRRTFGGQFEAWAARVPRWIGRGSLRGFER